MEIKLGVAKLRKQTKRIIRTFTKKLVQSVGKLAGAVDSQQTYHATAQYFTTNTSSKTVQENVGARQAEGSQMCNLECCQYSDQETIEWLHSVKGNND